MRISLFFASIFPVALALGACAHGNIKSVSDYTPPKAPPLRYPYYNSYSPYGEANATWQPPVFDRDGTVARPSEPATDADRPPYETAPWATGAFGGSRLAPPGTF